MTFRQHFRTLVALLAVAACAGCELLEEARESNYQTVTANPQHDPVAAAEEHAKALKIVSRHLAGGSANLAKAESHLQKALVSDVTYGPAHNTLGTVYMRQRKYYVAAWEFEYAAKVMPDRYEPLYNLGQVYECADKLDSAIVYYEQALALSPRNPCIIGNLVRAQMKNGKTVNDVRPMLEEIVFLDSRPEWVNWARDELGRTPVQTAAATSTDSEKPSEKTKPPESLPALPPEPGLEQGPRLNRPTPPPPAPQPAIEELPKSAIGEVPAETEVDGTFPPPLPAPEIIPQKFELAPGRARVYAEPQTYPFGPGTFPLRDE